MFQVNNVHISGIVTKPAISTDFWMESTLVGPLDSILIMSVLQNLKTTCSPYGSHERAAIWLLQQFVKGPAEAALANRICASDSAYPQQERKLTTYSQVLNYVVAKVGTDDVTAEKESESLKFDRL